MITLDQYLAATEPQRFQGNRKIMDRYILFTEANGDAGRSSIKAAIISGKTGWHIGVAS